MKRLLSDFSVFERPRRISFLPRELSEEEVELTPTLKTKLLVVQRHWAAQIDRLFEAEREG